jgi:hypothetical protein
MTIAGRYDIICDQGSTFDRTFVYRDADKDPIDNTGWSAAMHVRQTFGADSLILDANTENGMIILGGINGEIYVNIPYTIMDSIDSGVFVYDIELYTGDSVFKPVRGSFTIRPEVTR